MPATYPPPSTPPVDVSAPRTPPVDGSPPPPPPPGRRDRGALWVTATGAALLGAAAAIFLAVRWEGLPAAAKLGVLAGLTGGVLLAGARLADRLPTTARVLTHLGALLLPLDVQAVATAAGWRWEVALIAQGAVAGGVFPLLARRVDSRLLSLAAAAGVAVAATGAGALTGVAAPVLVGAVALSLVLLAPRLLGADVPVALGAAAGVGAVLLDPVATVVAGGRLVASGWADPGAGALAAAGTLGAMALAVAAQRRGSTPIAVGSLGTAVVAGVAALGAARMPVGAEDLPLPVAFVAVEALALVVARDPLWRRPLAALAGAAEALAVVPALWALVALADRVHGGFGVHVAAQVGAPLTLALLLAAVRAGSELRRAAAAAAGVVVATATALTAPVLADAAVAPMGAALALLGVVAAGLAGRAGARSSVALAATATATAVGTFVASDDAAWLGAVLLGLGLAVVAAGVVGARPAIASLGGGVATLGTWVLLVDLGVSSVEPYTLPVAAHLLAAGVHVRRHHDVSSWLAHAPAVVVLAVPALAVRVGGGPGWHALVAGAVGVVAVVAGGWRRLAAPLVLGVLLLAAVGIHESLAVVASVPTWAWMAGAGTLLLGAGVALERTGTSPVTAGRDLARRFDATFR